MRELNNVRGVQGGMWLGVRHTITNLKRTARFAWMAILLVMVISPQLVGCAGPQSPYVIQDTGLHAERYGEIVWLDNHRVRFYGFRAWAPQGQEVHGVPPLIGSDYYIWDTDANQLVTEPSLEGVKRICVQGDLLTFIKQSPTDETKRLVVTRLKGQETVAPLVNAEWFNRFSCRYYEHKPDWIIDRYRALPLMDGHGYLNWAPPIADEQSFRNWPLRFHAYNSKIDISLPMGTREVWHNLVKYAPFRDAYLLYPVAYIDPDTGKEGPIGPWPKGKPVPMWWLTSDGKVTTEQVPYMPFMRGGSRGFFPTRDGIFIYTHKTDDLGKPGDAGGYLARRGAVIKLITGMIDNVTVSPDGCKVAFQHDPYTLEPIFERIKVKVITVCLEAHYAR